MIAVTVPYSTPALVFLLVFALILVLPRLAELARLPGLAGLLAGGVLIGPSGFGLLEREGMVALIGGAGLLYLMFQAGLELDLDELRLNRRGALVFGAATFLVPMTVATTIHFWLGFSTLAAILMGSCWSSHTLLAYPVFQRARVVTNRAVAVGVGGTIITDTVALLVLVAVAAAHQGDLTAGFVLLMVPKLVGATLVIMVALPRLADWFFAGIGRERSTRFLFVAFALFASAELAELAGVEGIIGAFLAGLAMNRRVTEGTPLAREVEFFGANFMVPFFLISVGMLVDPSVIIDLTTLRDAVAFLAAVFIGKSGAAIVSGAILRYDRHEVAALFALSVTQAAATLAAIFVGIEIGLLDPGIINPVVVVILVSSLTATLVANRVAPQLPPPPAKVGKLGSRVLVPLGAPDESGPVVRLAAMLAAVDAGTVFPITVLDLESTPDDVRGLHRYLTESVEPLAMAKGAEASSLVRLDLTPGAGMLHAAIEQRATCIFMGWRGSTTRRGAVFGDKLDTMVTASPVPVVLCRPGDANERAQRVVLAIDRDDLGPGGSPGLILAAEVARRLAERAKLKLVLVGTVTETEVHELDGLTIEGRFLDETMTLAQVVADRTVPGDIVVKSLSTFAMGLGASATIPRLTRSLRGRTVLAVAHR